MLEFLEIVAVMEAKRESFAVAKREEEERSLPLMGVAAALDVDDEDCSRYLLRTSLIRF